MQKKQPAQFWGKLRHPQMSFGLGWDMAEIPDYENKGIHVLGKSGGTGHYTSMVYTVPDKRIAVAVITTGHSSAMEIARKILDAYLAEKGWMNEAVVEVKAPLKAQALPAASVPCNFYPRPPRGGRQQKQRQNLYFQTNYTTFCTNLEEP